MCRIHAKGLWVCMLLTAENVHTGKVACSFINHVFHHLPLIHTANYTHLISLSVFSVFLYALPPAPCIFADVNIFQVFRMYMSFLGISMSSHASHSLIHHTSFFPVSTFLFLSPNMLVSMLIVFAFTCTASPLLIDQCPLAVRKHG